jgi:hypothetical protein
MALAFTTNDHRQLKQWGIAPEQVAQQVEQFVHGVPWVRLQAPATAGGGIRVLSERQIEECISGFTQAQGEGRVMKFVPASGAASRMFHALHLFAQSVEDVTAPDPVVEEFFHHLDRFAFTEILWDACEKQGLDRKALTHAEGRKRLIQILLGPQGLNYEKLPKGLIPFHAYPDGARTAFEEHLAEGLQYIGDLQGKVRIHFTVSREHRQKVSDFLSENLSHYESLGGKFQLSYSEQKASTDTIAVDLANKPFRLEGGSLLFRPGGHGALLENLSECGGDIVFIKNIDNVTHDRWKPLVTRYKKALGGLLVQIQFQLFSYLQELESGPVAPQRLDEIRRFIEVELGFRGASLASQASIHHILHRPLRVCGMVPNRGEPGGAPFWVEGESLSLQIVESSQVNRQDPDQWHLFQSSTHFNPVDLVCGLRDHRGRAFDLRRFRDQEAVFISEKTHGGRALKALELPGLWNGGMAHWNTIFVEVPVEIFAPVKMVNDLLRPQHQP